MNRPEHLFERLEQDQIPADSPWKFKMNTPRYLYNKGELYNLGIRRGTLTEEERYVINDHIVQTILMLGKLPLPDHLCNVPEIAGNHHETMDGKGYPRRLSSDSMSWSARMMAIADIFEALTASDRPYKPGKTLSQALKIMDEFNKRKHIDPDLYKLFIESGIPQEYAKQYLKPEQLDI
jgi:HD-GYP domain-containing protein (c-di-GMP phosphodiesterase class II)